MGDGAHDECEARRAVVNVVVFVIERVVCISDILVLVHFGDDARAVAHARQVAVRILAVARRAIEPQPGGVEHEAQGEKGRRQGRSGPRRYR